MSNKCIAIITARGGSQRIPRKNIRPFCGKPIIAYPIEAALKSELFDEVMVSTDDKEIAEISMHFGAKVPFMRSAKNSDNFAMTEEVLIEVIGEYKKLGQNFDSFCCLYPTTPFVTSEKLKEGFDILQRNDVEVVMPVVRFGYPIQRALKLSNGLLEMIEPKHLRSRSQDLMPAYHDCGMFYYAKVGPFLKSGELFTTKTAPLILSETEMQDIDNEDDWKIAEQKYTILTDAANR